jgi:hypothetical protein
VLTADDFQRLILLEVGAGLDGNDPVEAKILDKITPNIALLWVAWSDKAAIFPRLQYLYCKKQCLDIIEGQLRDLVTTTVGGYNSNQQQKLANLQAIHKRVARCLRLRDELSEPLSRLRHPQCELRQELRPRSHQLRDRLGERRRGLRQHLERLDCVAGELTQTRLGFRRHQLISNT